MTAERQRIYLVRHGETEWNARGICQGRADVPLSPRGRAQARALGRRLRSVPFDVAYSSPLARARATAEAVLAGRRTRAVTVEGLCELSYGARQGTAVDDWPPHDAAQWLADPWSVTFPLGESLELVRQRVARVVEEALADHAGRTVLFSGHGHVNRVLLLHLLEWPRGRFWEIEQPNGSCTVLERCDGEMAPRWSWVEAAAPSREPVPAGPESAP